MDAVLLSPFRLIFSGMGSGDHLPGTLPSWRRHERICRFRSGDHVPALFPGTFFSLLFRCCGFPSGNWVFPGTGRKGYTLHGWVDDRSSTGSLLSTQKYKDRKSPSKGTAIRSWNNEKKWES